MNRKEFKVNMIKNLLQTGVILIALFSLMCLLGYTLAGTQGIFMALLAGMFLAGFGPHLSNKRILQAVKAQQLTVELSPQLNYLVAQIARKAGLKQRPKLYLIGSREPNAFAIGNAEDSAIVLSKSLLSSLNIREIAGIIGHEMAHIYNNDLQVFAIADIFRRITHGFAVLGQFFIILSLPALLVEEITYPLMPLILLIFSPTIGVLLQLALSRTREFEADRVGVKLAGDIHGLASALQKMERMQAGLWRRFIPLAWQKQPPIMLRTHPATSERVARLRSLIDDSASGLQQRPHTSHHSVMAMRS